MPRKLPYDQFLKSFELAPRVAVDLWVKNERGSVLYLKRETEPFIGKWHVPGSFLLKGEPVKDCVKRIAKEEIGLDLNGSDFKLLWSDEELNEPRGHVVHLVYSVRVYKKQVAESEKQKFFFEPPADLIPSHRKIFLNLS